MIEGWFPLLCLWLTVAGAGVSLALILLTPWRRTELGGHLVAFTTVLVVWWLLILLGSYLPGYPGWLQALQALAFAGIPLTIWWRVSLQLRARHSPLHRKEPAPHDDQP